MPGPEPKHPDQRRRRNTPVTEWSKTESAGWQHGDIPQCPQPVSRAAEETWRLWFEAWWAAWWAPADVPQLELALRLWDKSQSDPSCVTKFGPLAQALGLTPKGRRDNRWLPPEESGAEEAKPAEVRRLKVVDKGA